MFVHYAVNCFILHWYLTLYWHFVVILCLSLCAFYCKSVCVCHAINKCNLLTYLLQISTCQIRHSIITLTYSSNFVVQTRYLMSQLFGRRAHLNYKIRNTFTKPTYLLFPFLLLLSTWPFRGMALISRAKCSHKIPSGVNGLTDGPASSVSKMSSKF